MIHVDTSDLDDLVVLLGKSNERLGPLVEGAVAGITRKVEVEARGNAQAMRRTGELASSVESEHEGLTGWVGADVRQASLLEYGTPKTGAPRPWLTGPAEQAQGDLIRALGKAVGKVIP